MQPIILEEQKQICGGAWGFLCGVAIGVGVGITITSSGAAAGPALLLAEWACTLEYVVRG